LGGQLSGKKAFCFLCISKKKAAIVKGNQVNIPEPSGGCSFMKGPLFKVFFVFLLFFTQVGEKRRVEEVFGWGNKKYPFCGRCEMVT